VKEAFDMRSRVYYFVLVFLLSITPSLFASDYFEYSKNDMVLAESLLKDPAKFHKYVLENRGLNSARMFFRNGQKFYFEGEDIVESKDEASGRCQVIRDYIRKTNTVIVFSPNFHPMANAYFQQGIQVVVGKWKEKDITSFHNNIIWISDRYKNNPAIIAMLIAHEVGHGLYKEYKSNKGVFPGEPDENPDNSSEICDELLETNAVEEYLAYAREGSIVDELHISDVMNKCFNAFVFAGLKQRAKDKFYELFGPIEPGDFENFKFQINYPDVKRCFRGYSYKKRKCGMPCKYFNEYKFCDNPVIFPPCHLWSKHMETLEEKK
jgi:hypothetical protein